MKYIYSTSQMSKLSLTLCTFSVTGSVAGLFLAVELFYKKHKKRTEIDIIRGQKQSVILGMLQLACHNPEINWKNKKMKMTRCSNECGKQQKTKQTKLGWQKQKEKEQKKEKLQGEKNKKEFRKITIE